MSKAPRRDTSGRRRRFSREHGGQRRRAELLDRDREREEPKPGVPLVTEDELLEEVERVLGED